jgi:hypothetical protein
MTRNTEDRRASRTRIGAANRALIAHPFFLARSHLPPGRGCDPGAYRGRALRAVLQWRSPVQPSAAGAPGERLRMLTLTLARPMASSASSQSPSL